MTGPAAKGNAMATITLYGLAPEAMEPLLASGHWTVSTFLAAALVGFETGRFGVTPGAAQGTDVRSSYTASGRHYAIGVRLGPRLATAFPELTLRGEPDLSDLAVAGAAKALLLDKIRPDAI